MYISSVSNQSFKGNLIVPRKGEPCLEKGLVSPLEKGIINTENIVSVQDMGKFVIIESNNPFLDKSRTDRVNCSLSKVLEAYNTAKNNNLDIDLSYYNPYSSY